MPMILIVDPIAVPHADLRSLPGNVGAELFVRAIRPVGRELLFTPEGTWDRYRHGQLPAIQLRVVGRALDAYLSTLPEFARVCLLGLAHDGGGSLAQKILTAQDATEELGVLEGFWQIAAKAARTECTVVSFGGTSFGGPFLLRRSRLLGLAPSIPIPVGRYRLEAHFDLLRVLSNWTPTQEFSLELWASRYSVPGPWDTDTAAAIRGHVMADEIAEASAFAQSRLEAIHGLYQRLAPAYAA